MSFAAADWTCKSCQEAAVFGAETALSEDVLGCVFILSFKNDFQTNRAEIGLLQRELCQNTTDDGSCAAFLPDFWRAIAGELYPVAWSHICDDIAVSKQF